MDYVEVRKYRWLLDWGCYLMVVQKLDFVWNLWMRNIDEDENRWNWCGCLG